MAWNIGMHEYGKLWELYITNDADRFIVLERSTSKYVIERELRNVTIQQLEPLPRGIQIGNHNVQNNQF